MSWKLHTLPLIVPTTLLEGTIMSVTKQPQVAELLAQGYVASYWGKNLLIPKSPSPLLISWCPYKAGSWELGWSP